MAEYISVEEQVIQHRAIALNYEVLDDDGEGMDVSDHEILFNVLDNVSTVVKTWTTEGAEPTITFPYEEGYIFLVEDDEGFDDWGYFRGEVVDVTDNYCLGFVNYNVEKEITEIPEEE
jgi:hypothetical protein